MKNFSLSRHALLLVLFGMVAAAGLIVSGHQVSAAELLMAAAVPAAVIQPLPWQRIREQSFNFQNVVATGEATGVIPRYARTLHRINLELGGTSLTHAMVTSVSIRLGSKTIWGPITGAHLNKLNAAKARKTHTSFLQIDLNDTRNKHPGGELIGGWDLTRFPKDVDLVVAVSISGATAPTLKGHCVWGQPQPKNNVISQLLQMTGAFSVTGLNVLQPDFQDGDLARLSLIYAGNDWTGTSGTATAASTNTGNGTMGAVTVSAACQVGTHIIEVTEPGSNIGTLVHRRPDGTTVAYKGAVASAYSDGELAFTLADGSTDFVAGDMFSIVVSEVNQGNIYRCEVKRDGLPIFDQECQVARFEQSDYGLVPQSKMLMTDFVVERNSIGLVNTKDAASLEVRYYATATDTFTLYAETLRDLDKSPL